MGWKVFDKIGKAITKGGSNIARWNQRKVAKRAGVSNSQQVKTFLESETVKDINHTFGVGVKTLARDFVISVATLGVGTVASAGNGVGTGVRAGVTAAQAAKYVKTA